MRNCPFYECIEIKPVLVSDANIPKQNLIMFLKSITVVERTDSQNIPFIMNSSRFRIKTKLGIGCWINKTIGAREGLTWWVINYESTGLSHTWASLFRAKKKQQILWIRYNTVPHSLVKSTEHIIWSPGSLKVLLGLFSGYHRTMGTFVYQLLGRPVKSSSAIGVDGTIKFSMYQYEA